MTNPIINPNIVQHVLEAFVDEFLVDVPAIHKDGLYLIEHDVLVGHISNLSYDDQVNIMLEATERYV